ncbi:MAG TPA: response regulator, partial [Candidatus Ruthenibacterium merdigallinarum]|nr:response regulator [Candidatus Ruthenibacterium merdigallinarum]
MKILLIDDEPHVTRAIRQLVPWEELGIDVILEAFSGRDAMQLIEREDPQIVLTDVVMPDLTGL